MRKTSSYLEAAAVMAGSPLRALEAGGEALTACFVLSLSRVAGVGDFSVGGYFFSSNVFAFCLLQNLIKHVYA